MPPIAVNVPFVRRMALLLPLALATGCVSGGEGGGEIASEAADAPVVVRADASPWRGSGLGAYLAARHAQAARDTSAAADLLLLALERDGENVNLLEQATALLIVEGRIDEAAKLANRLLSLNSESTIAGLLLAVRAAERGNWQEAREVLEGLPDRSLNSFVVPPLVAWAHAGENDADAAMEALAPLAQSTHLASLHDFHAALIADLTGRPDTARPFYEATLSGKGASTLRAAQAAGSFFQRTGDMQRAREVYEEYTRRNAGTRLLDAQALLAAGAEIAPLVPTARDGMAEALYSAASSLRQGNALEVALVLGRLALELKPGFPLAQALVGDILEGQGRLADANAIYAAIGTDSAVKLAADLRRAANLDALERTEEAVALLEQLAETYPELPDPLVSLGDVQRRHKRFAEAAEAYDRALARVDEVEQDHWAIFYSRGIAYERSGQWTKAESDFLKALELEPDQPLVLNYLAYSWVEQGANLERAREMIEQAVALRPNDGYIVDSMGWILYRMGEYEEAVKHLERAVELSPHDTTINDHLGDALWKVGRRQEARYQWQRALSLEPEPDMVETIREKLARGLEGRTAAQ